MFNEDDKFTNTKYLIMKEINNNHLSKNKIRPNFIHHDSISYKSDCELGNKTKIKYRTPSEIARDIKKQNEIIVDQLQQQKKNLTYHIIKKQFNREQNKFVPPNDFTAFIESEVNGVSQNDQTIKQTYNVFDNQNDAKQIRINREDNINDAKLIDKVNKDNLKTQEPNKQENYCKLPFLKKRMNTPPISQTRLTFGQINNSKYNETEQILDKYNNQYSQPYNLAQQYNVESLQNILQSRNDLNTSQTKLKTQNDDSLNQSNIGTASTIKSSHRAKRAISEQGIRQFKKQQGNNFEDQEFYMYMKEVSQNREQKYQIENSINKLLNNLKDESTSEIKKINPQNKKNRRSVSEIKRVQFDQEGKEVRRYPTEQLTKLQELSKKTFCKDNIKIFIRKIILNLKDYLYIHEKRDIPKHKMFHLGADRPKIAQVLFNKMGFLKKNLADDDILAVIYPKDYVRSEEDRRSAPSAENNFDLKTYFDFQYFNIRLQEYIQKKNTKTLINAEAGILKQTEAILKKKEEIIKDNHEKTIDKFRVRVRGQSQNIHSQILRSEDNYTSYKDYNVFRQQYLMDYMNKVEKRLGNLELITHLTRTTYNQITDVIKDVQKKTGEQ